MDAPFPERTDRSVASRGLYRTINLELRRRFSRWTTATPFDAVCECDDRDCAVAISIDGDVFDSLAQHPGRLVVAAAHPSRPGDRVVARYRDAVVVDRVA